MLFSASLKMTVSCCTVKSAHSSTMMGLWQHQILLSYMLVYVDNILCIHKDPNSVLKVLKKYFPLAPDSVWTPDIYLGAKLKQLQVENGFWAWGISPSKYVREAQFWLPALVPNPFPTMYEPGGWCQSWMWSNLPSYFQSLIWIMNWMIK